MKRWTRFIIYFAIFIAITAAVVTASAVTVSAAKNEVNTKEEFYDLLAQQIYDREALGYYTVTDSTLMDSLYHLDMEAFSCHYNAEEPLLSGCYLIYYVDTIYTTYQNQTLKVMINFPYPKGNMDEHFEMMARLAQSLKGETDYDTIVNVHDYLIDNYEYDHRSSMENHTDIDGFKDGVMVCSGYGLATYYLLNEAGVETRILTGDGGGGPHMWNLVKLGDEWYNLDVTWDDRGNMPKSYDYFLKSDKDFPNHTRSGGYNNANFNVRIAEKSYKHPFYMGKSSVIKGLVLLVIILMIIYFKFITASSKKNTVPTGTVVKDDFDEWMKDNEHTPSMETQKLTSTERELFSSDKDNMTY